MAFATYVIGAGVVRSLISDVYAVLYADELDPDAPRPARYPAARGAFGAAFLVALIGSVGCLVAALVAEGDLRSCLLVLAIGLPLLVMQDVARYISITRRDAFGASLNDGMWAVAFGGGVVAVTLVSGFPGAVATFALWAIGGACGFFVASLRMRALPGIRAGIAFLRRVWRYSARYVGDWLALGASVQLGYYLLGATAGLALVGELRAGMLLIGPLNIVVVGAAIITVPELRRYYRSHGPSWKPAVLLTAVLVGMTLAWFVVIVLLPDSFLRAVFGDGVDDTLDLLPALFLYAVINMAAQGPLVALRATGNARRGTSASAPVAPIVLLGASIGAWVTGDAVGALLAWSVSGLVTIALGTWQLRRALAEPDALASDDGMSRLDSIEREANVMSATDASSNELPPVFHDP